MTDSWTARLSEFVDGSLEADDERALEAHLEDCAVCARTVDELRAVVRSAAALENREPDADLWRGVADRIRAGHIGEHPIPINRARSLLVRFGNTMPQLAAAALVLVLIGGGGFWLGGRDKGAPPQAPGAALTIPGGDVTAMPIALAGTGAEYDAAIAELRHALDEHRDQLDSVTVRVLEDNLAIIDQAIAEAVAALEAEPADQYLNAHLTGIMRRKLRVLTHAVSMVTAET